MLQPRAECIACFHVYMVAVSFSHNAFSLLLSRYKRLVAVPPVRTETCSNFVYTRDGHQLGHTPSKVLKI